LLLGSHAPRQSRTVVRFPWSGFLGVTMLGTSGQALVPTSILLRVDEVMD